MDDQPTPDPIVAIAEAARLLERSRRWERDNRIALLWVHAQVGVFVGLLMLINGTATTFQIMLGQDAARFYTGLPALTGGLLLVVGLASRPRRIWFEVAGLTMLAIWDLAMAAGFIKSLIDASPILTPKAYPVAVYAGYFELLLVHIWTLFIRKRRP